MACHVSYFVSQSDVVVQVTNQNKKKSRREDRTTCRPNENSGPVNKISMVQTQRTINAMALRVLCFNIGFTELGLGEDPCLVGPSTGSFIRLLSE